MLIICLLYSFALSTMLVSPPQPAGLRNCNAAAFASFKKYAIAFFEFQLRRNQTKGGGLCSYWF